MLPYLLPLDIKKTSPKQKIKHLKRLSILQVLEITERANWDPNLKFKADQGFNSELACCLIYDYTEF